ncbi:chemotaxis regulator CheZ [Pseudovibrio axinellae]|uniref:Chemotaxis regulator CheZ n=1 Tax=Pseudovibrio axinellae TaxID=989403 RepID=A0A165T5Y9_9HYPH|nr:protein phosphatase CheZ [Pseudovibrio axinellae]KZL05484.1 chemotaxis regulator CheZ [Pseudovibrio axinellae]SEP97299.1 chemotaxis protein CheZ [Pseudovibrio axinellae]
MSVVRKTFRAEAQFAVHGARAEMGSPIQDNGEAVRHNQVMEEIAGLKEMLATPGTDPQELSRRVAEELREEIGEAAKLKRELDAIYEAIAETKTEIAALHTKASVEHDERGRVTLELDAIVSGTEGATEQILSAAEMIDQNAATVLPMVPGEHEGLVSDIHEQVVSIFEACNFQDLTGQRISKVVNTLSFVEERIIRMIEIWGGIESFKEFSENLAINKREDDAALLHGPSLDVDAGTVTQDDIDALFD